MDLRLCNELGGHGTHVDDRAQMSDDTVIPIERWRRTLE